MLLGDKVSFIKKCPECGTPLVRMEGEAAYYCPNDVSCPPQIKGKMEHFVTRKAMNINIGPETIEDLYNAGYVHNAADLYLLKVVDMLRLERWAEKSAHNLIDSIAASKAVPFARVLYAVGIRYVGETVAKRLASAFRSMDALRQASFEELTSVDDIGDRIAQSVIDYFADGRNVSFIERLKDYGVQMESKAAPVESASDKLKGLSIVISGTFDHHSRDEYKELIEQNGGKNVASVSGKTDFILAGANMGPSKLEKATKLGVKIVSENEFLEMIGEAVEKGE